MISAALQATATLAAYVALVALLLGWMWFWMARTDDVRFFVAVVMSPVLLMLWVVFFLEATGR